MGDIRGQGKRKKIKVEPSQGADDNLPGIRQHPLLNDLVLEVLFEQLSSLKNDESLKSTSAHLAELRLVCKAWNKEIGKMIGKETRINVIRLITAYPNGLGWAPTTTTAEDLYNKGFKYSVPRPETIGTFEHLSLTIKTCDDLRNTSVLKWFQMTGSSVKSLHLTCPLSCYHQNRFVERILKKWCPNLRSFALRGVECLESLVHNCFFAEPSLENECRSLKEFIFFFDGLERSQLRQFCGLKIKDLERPRGKKLPTVAARKQIHGMLLSFVEDLVDYVDLGVEPFYGLSLAEQLNNLVTRPLGLSSLEGMTPRSFGSHVAPFFQKSFTCDPGYENDGGIIGQLMKMSKVEKLVIHNADQKWFFNELFAMFYFRPNLWSSSLTHFECFGHCPPVAAQKMFSRIGFPLKKLNFSGDFLLDAHGRFGGLVRFDPKSVERILRNCSETLEELEFGTSSTSAFTRHLILPTLPKLKTLVVESNAGDHEVRLTCQGILKKLPKLERCVVTLSGQRGSSAGFFGGTDGSWKNLESHSQYSHHPLQELKLLDLYVDKRDMERMVRWLPNLKVVDLSIRQGSGDDFKAFWEEMGKLPLEQIRISFSVKSARHQAYNLYEDMIVDHVNEFKDLQRLELIHEGPNQFPLTSKLSKEFAKVAKLRALKFTNFEVGIDEREEIQKNLAYVAFQLPDLRPSDARRMRMSTMRRGKKT